MSVVEQYWSGVLRRLEAEVYGFNELIGHMGEKGRENELSLARLLEKLVPVRYGIGSGLLIDAEGRQSKQMDIVIYDQMDEPAIMAQTNQVLFPVENVRACIEVKTTASERELKDAAEKHASIRALSSQSGIHPVFALAAYSAGQQAETLARHLVELDANSRPDLACVLELGLLAMQAQRAHGYGLSECEYLIGVTPLQKEGNEGRIVGEYFEPTMNDEVEEVVGGNIYPVVSLPDREVLGEPSRALLLFCEGLLGAIAEAEQRAMPTFHHYVTATARDMYILQQVV